MSRRSIRNNNNNNKSSGVTQRIKEVHRDRIGYNNHLHGIYTGQVESAEDETRTGRLLVHVPMLNRGSPNVPGERRDGEQTSGFIWCHPILPFFTLSDWEPDSKNQQESAQGFTKSAGIWGPMPQVGDLVAVAFLDGGTPVWLGAIPVSRKNFMIPGIPGDEVEGKSDLLPATERASDSEEIRKAAKVLADNIKQAGLANDAIRGPGTSGATRESPSRVSGWKTLGVGDQPGHSFIMDDDPSQQGIRFRTSHGHQITLSDVTHSIYIATSKGNSWIEINEDGKIDIFSSDSVSVHTETDLNIRADGNYTLDIGGNMTMAVGGDLSVDVKGNTDELFAGYVKTNIGKNFETKVSKKYKLASTEDMDMVGGAKTTIASKAAMNVYGSGTVAIDSGTTVEMERGLASLPDFSASTSVLQSTAENLGVESADIGELSSGISVATLTTGVDAGLYTTALNQVSGTGLPLGELNGGLSGMLASGIEVGDIASSLNGLTDNLSNISDGLLSQLEGFDLTLDSLDINSLGIDGVLENISNANLPTDLLDQLVPSNLTDKTGDIAKNTQAFKSINSVMKNVDMNAFRDTLSSMRENLPSEVASQLSLPQLAAFSAVFSTAGGVATNGVENVTSLVNNVSNPVGRALDGINTVRLKPEELATQISAQNITGVVDQFSARGLLPRDATQIFGQGVGQNILGAFDNSEALSSLSEAFSVLEGNGQLENLLGEIPAGIGQDALNLTSALPGLDLANTPVSGLSNVLNEGLSGPASAIPKSLTDAKSLPGAPSEQQIANGEPGEEQTYVSPRVPQHEPWTADGRIVINQRQIASPSAIGKGSGRKSLQSGSQRPDFQKGETGSGGEGGVLEESDIDFIVVHCSATQADARDGSKAYDHTTIERYHTQSRGWSSIGYHYVINRDGSVVNTLPETRRGNHVAGYNSVSLAVCLVGGIDSRGRPEANFTRRQLQALRNLLNNLLSRYPNAELKGHRDFNQVSPPEKACPSMNIQVWYKTGRIQDERV